MDFIANTDYGYIRVSTREQNEARQKLALRAFGIPEQNIYLDKQSGKDLMGSFIAELVLQILSFVAQSERENIKKRQREGIAAAKTREVRFGRPEVPIHESFVRVAKQWNKGLISTHTALEKCDMSRSAFYRRRRELRIIRK